jgi:hypothetical protein
MLKRLKLLVHRIKDHWQTSVVAVLVLAGYYYFHTDKIDFTDFKEYLILVPSVILLLSRDWKKPDAV